MPSAAAASLLLGSGNAAVATSSCKPHPSSLPRSALGFVLCFAAFAVTGVVRHAVTDTDPSSRLRIQNGGGGENSRIANPDSDFGVAYGDADPLGGGMDSHDAVGMQGASAAEEEKEDPESPKVVWIMSFGGSGTSYTITNLEHLTGYTTGTNYAADIRPNVPVVPEFPNGPFLHLPENPVPPFVVSKTHCGAYCMDCGPESYHNATLEGFEMACRTCSVSADNAATAAALRGAMSSSSNSAAYTTYETPVERAIHLIRSPFDNLVGRMHLAGRHRQKRGESGFDDSAAGYSDWCRYLDAKYGQAEAQLPDLDWELPCRAEWYRYVQWHNLAWEVTSRLFDEPSKVHRLHYESYSSRYDDTVRSLLEFVHLQPAPDTEPLPFLSNKTYADYFSPDDRERAKRYVRSHAHPPVWDLLAGYF